jgi:hypothetical protein
VPYGDLDISMPRNGQAWFAENVSANEGETYEPITCTACTRVHLVNRATGRALGGDNE